MTINCTQDWDPQSKEVQRNQRKFYDLMREKCPIAYSEFSGWSVFKYQDVKQILLDHHTFSNRVSKHVSVPNGMDLPEHTSYRKMIDPYFSERVVAGFRSACENVADDLMKVISKQDTVEVMRNFAYHYAIRVQSAFMGWDTKFEPVLLDWIQRNNKAVLRADRPVIKKLALEFEAIIAQQLALIQNPTHKNKKGATLSLLNEKIQGKHLTHKEIASVLRNWTVGEVGTIAASAGIIIRFLATHPDIQEELRKNPERVEYANDEILRLFNPLVTNRRRTTKEVTLRGKTIPAGAPITINWIAANRDPEVFDDAYTFSWDRDPALNLLYGAGLHVCPGKLLAQMELIVMTQKFLDYSKRITLKTNKAPIYAEYPTSGYVSVPVVLD